MIPIIHIGAVDSTNAEAWRLIKQGQAPNFALVAEQQLQGRGRSGHSWSSPPGNFYGSFVLETSKPESEVAQLSFVAALALAQVLENQGLEPRLKWPNDILIGDAKVSGILLERQGKIVMIGMGVNLMSHPDLETYATTSLSELKCTLTAMDLAKSLTHHLKAGVAQWETFGFEAVRAKWLERAHNLGQEIRVRFANGQEQHGRFSNLDTDGALQLETSNGLESVYAGQVFF